MTITIEHLLDIKNYIQKKYNDGDAINWESRVSYQLAKMTAPENEEKLADLEALVKSLGWDGSRLWGMVTLNDDIANGQKGTWNHLLVETRTEDALNVYLPLGGAINFFDMIEAKPTSVKTRALNHSIRLMDLLPGKERVKSYQFTFKLLANYPDLAEEITSENRLVLERHLGEILETYHNPSRKPELADLKRLEVNDVIVVFQRALLVGKVHEKPERNSADVVKTPKI